MTEANCPNCGAPVAGVMCEYCGTVFSDTSGKMEREMERYWTAKCQIGQMERQEA